MGDTAEKDIGLDFKANVVACLAKKLDPFFLRV